MAQFKVVLTDWAGSDIDLEAAELRDSGLDIELVRLNTKIPTELLPHVADADALIVQWANINRDVINALQKCRVISRYGIGVDMIDLQAAGERGIIVCNTPDYCIDEVSTHTVGFLLMLNRHIMGHMQHARSGQWTLPPGGAPNRLAGQVLGIVGLGNIGRVVAHKASCLGLKVLAYDPYVRSEQAAAVSAEVVTLDAVLSQSDYVTIHCPLNAETRHMFSTPQFKLMKPTAYLINMARGPIVDQVALYTALTDHTIAGAALDVLEQEPPPADEPLLKLDNVLITPHSSSWSAESVVQLRHDAAHNVVVALRGEEPRSVVNRKELRRANA
jgi:D-3-phosphoglycerate dehydrogenase